MPTILLLLLLCVMVDHPSDGEPHNQRPLSPPSALNSGGARNTPSNGTTFVISSTESSLLTHTAEQTGNNDRNRMGPMSQEGHTTDINQFAGLTVLNQPATRGTSMQASIVSNGSGTPASRNDTKVDDLVTLTGSAVKVPIIDDVLRSLHLGFAGSRSFGENRSEDEEYWDQQSTSWVMETSNSSRDQRFRSPFITSTPSSKRTTFPTGVGTDYLAGDFGLGHPVNRTHLTGENLVYPDYRFESTGDIHPDPFDWSRAKSSTPVTTFGLDWERSANNALSRFRAQCQQMQQERQHCDGTEWNVIRTAEFCGNGDRCYVCQCEDDCYEQGNCCLEQMLKDGLSQQQQKSAGCHNRFITPHKKPQHFSMVDQCQPGWGQDQVFQGCTNVSSQDVHGQWPVWSPVSEVTYRNQHCAACHGQDPDILQPWDLTVFCGYAIHWETFTSLQDAMKKISDTPDCVLGFNPPKDSRNELCDQFRDASQEQTACPANTSSLNVSSRSWFHRACEAFFSGSPSGENRTTPPNLPCALCNMAHFGTDCMSDIDTPFPFMLVMSATALFDVTSTPPRSCACAAGEMFDTYELDVTDNADCGQSRCRKLYCSTAKRLKGSHCVPAVKRLKGIGYELNLRLTPVNVSVPVVIDDVLFLDEFALDTLAGLQHHISADSLQNHIFQVVFRVENNGSRDVLASRRVILKEVDLKVQMYIHHLAEIEDAEDRLLNVMYSRLNLSFSVRAESRAYEVLPLFPGENKAKLFYDQENVQNVKYGVDCVFTNDTFSDYAVGVHNLVGFDSLGSGIDEYPPVQYTLNCTKVSFHLTKDVQTERFWKYSNPLMEKAKNRSRQAGRFAHSLNEHSGEIVLSLDRETGEVYHEPSGHTVGFQHVELRQEEDVVLVCVDQLYGPRRPLSPPALVLEKFFSTHMIYVSVACQSLSVVCLFLVLLTYCLFAELRTLPGKNTMGMVTSLFLAMLLFEVGVARVEMPALCTLLGVLIHLALLSAFTWMVLCSLHMHRVFTHVLASRHLRQPEAQSSLFVKHVLISLLVPAVIVAGTLLGNWLAHGTDGGCGEGEESEGVDVGYGRGICYVSNPLSLLLASVVPVCVAVGVNVLLFLFTVRSLHHLGQDALLATQQQRQQLTLYFRLSTLTGINWLVGPATTIIDSVIVWYIFIVLCGLQGVYVFIAFVCNRRVLSLYRTLFDCRKEAESESAPQLPGTGSTPLPPEEIDTKVKRKISAD